MVSTTVPQRGRSTIEWEECPGMVSSTEGEVCPGVMSTMEGEEHPGAQSGWLAVWSGVRSLLLEHLTSIFS